ncbi:hypothetical protein Enr17x_20790 [Gimesia fumaroli]|uniref:Uncharacterized protein n=2 Tax=Gimesia fumaroli TaxID=2527976 RepID=A0A518IA80_9PLAN|nr:hypothetical protein Enr17x_20790 [Gimesia fumaroli]
MNRVRSRRIGVYCLLATFMANSIIPTQVLAGSWSFYKIGKSTTIGALAKKIDHVQHRLDKFGTIVAKSPDVWGESRLLQHRDEFEKVIKEDLKTFEETLQGAQSTRDSAFLASALSLSNVLGTPIATPSTTEEVKSNTQIFVATADQLVPDNTALNSKDNNLVPRSSGFGPQFANEFTSANSSNKKLSISLEPTVFLDQKKRYLDHLNALRRLNEGDDIADSPGYALNLVRIPVSVLPGRETRKGYGAQVSITVDPYASEELLPEAFRNFVINGVINRIAPTVTNVINNDSEFENLDEAWKKYSKSIMQKSNDSQRRDELNLEYQKLQAYQQMDSALQDDEQLSAVEQKIPKIKNELDRLNNSVNDAQQTELNSFNSVMNALDNGKKSGRAGVIEQLGSAPFVNSKRAYPPSLSQAVSGTSLASVSISAHNHLQMNGELIHLEDVRRYLILEIQAAYDLLSQPELTELWYDHNLMNDIKNAIIENRTAPGDKFLPRKLSSLRKEYYERVSSVFPGASFSPTINIGWHILVESVMLNERLIEDIKSVSANKNCCQMPPEGLVFYGPEPSIEARVAFQDYIRCRWPIHVFALDPVTDDQNIADSFSQRRELQLALAIAASKGIFGAQSLTRFVRRLEYDLETIQLNRTAVGFSHGNDTFGWRFYPRVQTLPAPGSITAFGQTLIGGQSREKRLKHQMLEPAMRECSALIVMPSFIPYITVDVQTNWFKLSTSFTGKFLKRQPDLSDAVALSKDVTKLRELASLCKKDEHLYRDGETHRLLRAVEQIERQLPLQTAFVQIPYENNLSGFEIFNNGVTDLGPELIDWYGGPGIAVGGPNYKADHQIHELTSSPPVTKTTLEKRTQLEINNPPTTLFLVGKNFTSLGNKTRIIAGGVDISDSRVLVSRNVIQVTVPSHVVVEESGGKDVQKYVDVHIATPHGVTSHLEIPAVEPKATAAQASIDARLAKVEKEVKEAKQNPPLQFEWLTTEIDGCLDLDPTTRNINLQLREDPQIKIDTEVLPPEAHRIKLSANLKISTDDKKETTLVKNPSGPNAEIFIEADILRWRDPQTMKLIAGVQIPAFTLSSAIADAISESTHVNNDIKAIKLSGTIQVFLNGSLDPLPIYSVNKSLTIKLAHCKECKKCDDVSVEPATEMAPESKSSGSVPPAPLKGKTPVQPAPSASPKTPAPPELKPYDSSILYPPVSRPVRHVSGTQQKTTSQSKSGGVTRLLFKVDSGR